MGVYAASREGRMVNRKKCGIKRGYPPKHQNSTTKPSTPNLRFHVSNPRDKTPPAARSVTARKAIPTPAA